MCLVDVACTRSPLPATGVTLARSAAASAPGASVPSPSAAALEGAPRITASADGVHIEYHVYGHGDPAVVLIHGWSCNSSYWREQLADLASRYTTVTLDLAGHGGSGRNRTDWTMARYGEDVAAVVRQIPSARIVLIGHLMGGPVALEAAPLIGDRLIGIIGVDTFTRLGLPPPPRPLVDRQIAPFRADFVGHMHSFVPQLFAKTADPAFVRKVADDMSREPPQIAIPTLIELNSLDFATVLPRIHVPIIAIESALGESVSEARVRRTVPGFRVVTVKSAGHFLTLEDPRDLNPLLLKEIAAMAAPRP